MALILTRFAVVANEDLKVVALDNFAHSHKVAGDADQSQQHP